MRQRDWLVNQLPVGMIEDDPILVKLVRGFQEVADTVLQEIDALPHAFDLTLTPLPIVRLMGAWIGVMVDSSFEPTTNRQRAVVSEYARRLSWRGTRSGLTQLLATLTGHEAEQIVVDDDGGVYLADQAPTTPAEHVRIEIPAPNTAITPIDLVRIVRDELPASVTFELRVADVVVWPRDPAPSADVATGEEMEGALP